jgi:hypothetical protein
MTGSEGLGGTLLVAGGAIDGRDARTQGAPIVNELSGRLRTPQIAVQRVPAASSMFH